MGDHPRTTHISDGTATQGLGLLDELLDELLDKLGD